MSDSNDANSATGGVDERTAKMIAAEMGKFSGEYIILGGYYEVAGGLRPRSWGGTYNIEWPKKWARTPTDHVSFYGPARIDLPTL